MATLLPCPIPWCQANTNPERGSNRLPMKVRGSGWQVVCPFCGTKGPNRPAKAEAIAAWNTRTPSGLSLPESDSADHLGVVIGRKDTTR